jgi:hypothetical protein
LTFYGGFSHMRLRAPALLLASLAACAISPAAASAADSLLPYSAEVTAEQAGLLNDQGFDIAESGFDATDGSSQNVEFVATQRQVAGLKRDGIAAAPMELDPPMPKSKAFGDSPNRFFNVYRTYMEPGGIADEMRALAAANPDVMKLERIGTSTLGKPILVIKMTDNARNVADGSRDAILFSAVNHAREWIAAEMGRRLPGWFADHKNDPRIRELIKTRELWFMPIQNPDGYDYTFTCGVGVGVAAVPCDYRTLAQPYNNANATVTNRYWRKTLRDNNANGVYGDPGNDGVDPNRNYPAKRGIDEEGANNNIGQETYRGPYALSEPENLAFDQLLRRVKFRANINYHSAGQLLLTPVSYTTDYAPPDATLFNAITGTDGDSAVFPYQPQRSSDLYESNGDTIDNAYLNHGVIGWTPEMDQCATMGGPTACDGSGLGQFASPDDEEKVAAVFNKNLKFVLNVVHSLPDLGRPRNFDNDPSEYKVKATQDIQVNRFDVSYGTPQTVEAIVRKELGPADLKVTWAANAAGGGGSGTTATIRMAAAPAGERYGEAPGLYFERRRAEIPSIIGTHTLVAGDVVNVIVLAGGLQQEFRYRIAATRADATKKRVLVVAAEDYKGVSPNVTPGYDTAPRYLDTYKSSLEALGYEVATYDVDAPPANGGTPNGVVNPPIKYPTYLGVLKHFDAVVYESGDDFVPQDITNTNPRRMTSATAQTGSQEMAGWFHHAMLELRDYANEGGKLIVTGRGVHQAPTAAANGAQTGNVSLGTTGPYSWTPDKLFGFFYPDNNAGDDDLAGTAFQRSRSSSNDTWGNYLGVAGRQGGIGTTAASFAAAPVAPKSGGLFDGMTAITVDSTAGNDPNQTTAGAPLPLAKIPLRLRNWAAAGATNEPLRAERVEADYTTTPAQNATGGAIISTRDSVTFGFGLEQVDAASRGELLKRSLDYLVPAAADTTPPTINGFKYPVDNSTATPSNPVDLEVTAFDNRGDMGRVDLYADGVKYASVPVYPFQFRYTPPAAAVGQTVSLTAVATDKAGSTATSGVLHVNVVAGAAAVESPLPVGAPTLGGSPVVGQVLTCISGGFLNAPESFSHEWLRSDGTIRGATAASYTLTSADLGRRISCHMSATNSAGTGDATSDDVTVSAAPAAGTFPAPLAGTPGPAGPAGPAAPKGIVFAGSCKLASSGKSVTCTIGTVPPTSKSTRLTSTVRVAGTSKSVTKSGKGSVKVTVRSTKRLKKGQKMTLKVRFSNTIKVVVLKAS